MNLLNAAQRQYLKDLATISGFFATSDPPNWLESRELAELRNFLKDNSHVEKIDRYRFRIGTRVVDFNFLEESWPV